MNKDGLDKLLSRRKHNGETLGRLLLLSDIEFKRTKGKSKSFDDAKMQMMVNTLDRKEMQIYNSYICLYNFIHFYSLMGSGFYQQIIRDFYRLTLMITNPSVLKEIKDMDEIIRPNDFYSVFSLFTETITHAYALHQMYRDIEYIYNLEGLSKEYNISSNLNEFMEAFNNVLEWAHKNKKNFEDIQPLNEKNFIPSESRIKKARDIMKDITVFTKNSGDPALFMMYVPDEKV